MIDLLHGVDADYDDLPQYIGWWQQEKYRGVRFVWDGSAAWTRQGREIELPANWYDAMPTLALDCEIYDGPTGESRCSVAVRHGSRHITPSMRLIAFDAPEHDGPWEDRINAVRVAVEDADFDRLEWAPFSRVQSVEHLLMSLADVHAREGEGLMLRKPGMLYEPGYQSTLIKVKHAY